MTPDVLGDNSVQQPTSGMDHRELLGARWPALYFGAKIGDSLLTLPTLRALGERFESPLTLICPKFAFDLCFREVSPRLADTTGFFDKELPPQLGAAPTVDPETLASRIGNVDVLISTLSFNMMPYAIRIIRQHLSPAVTVGFKNDYEQYDILAPKLACHSADRLFELVRVFDPAARIDEYTQPVPIPPAVQAEARSVRAALPAGVKVLVVHADSDWIQKQWPVTRFIDVLDRFLARHRDYVAWVVGMGAEELNVGRERDRVIPYLGLPLDFTMALVSCADLFLGIDSCMLHAADLARVPGVGLFGPTRSGEWGFRFTPHRHIDRRTMADITVDEVLAALQEVAEEAVEHHV